MSTFTRSSLAQSIVAVSIIAIASFSLFQTGMFAVHDFLHTARIAEMARGLQDGQFPVIWSQNFSYGLGMPLFEFYAPVPYGIGGLILLITGNAILATKLIWILPTVLIVSGTYLLSKKLTDSSWLALASAALVALAPYRAVQLYLRGSLAEAWAMGWYVWLLLGLVLVVQRKKHGTLLMVLAGCCLVLSHNISTLLIIIPTIMFWVGLLIQQLKDVQPVTQRQAANVFWKSSLRLGVIALIIVGLTAFYTVPSLLEKSATKVDQYVLAEYFTYSNHFVFLRQLVTPHWGYGGSEWGPADSMSFFLGFAQLLVLVLAVAAAAASLLKKIKLHTPYIFYGLLGTALISVLLATGRSEWLWQLISPLEYLQFPWRFLGVAGIFIGLVGVFPFAGLSNKIQLLIALTIITLTIGPAFGYFRPESSADVSSRYYLSDAEQIASQLSQYLPDYMYRELPDDIRGGAAICLSPDSVDARQLACSAVRTELRSNRQTWSITTDQPTIVVLPIANFPGWKVAVDSRETAQQEREGQIAVFIDGGLHVISTEFGWSSARKIGVLISGFTLVAGVAILIADRRKQA